MFAPVAPRHEDADEAIRVSDLRRTFRKRSGWRRPGELVEAVRGIDFAVPEEQVTGFLIVAILATQAWNATLWACGFVLNLF